MQQWPYKALGRALEVIPRTLIQNCGANTIRVLTQLRVRARTHTFWFAFFQVTLPPSCPSSLYLPLVSLLTWKAKHATAGNTSWGVNGDTGEVVDMNVLGVWDPLSVKEQTLKTAVEVSNFSLTPALLSFWLVVYLITRVDGLCNLHWEVVSITNCPWHSADTAQPHQLMHLGIPVNLICTSYSQFSLLIN